MEYFDSFLKEVLRLYPPVGLQMRRTAFDENWKGFVIPAKTRFMIPVHLLHRHPKYWKDPEVFRPERWSSGDEPTHKFAYIPFSAGGRYCIGQRFAQMEAKLIMANIRAFQIQLAPDQRDTEFTFTVTITTKSKPNVKIVAKPR